MLKYWRIEGNHALCGDYDVYLHNALPIAYWRQHILEKSWGTQDIADELCQILSGRYTS